MRVYGDVHCQTLNSTDRGDHVSLFISRVRTNSEQKGGTDTCRQGQQKLGGYRNVQENGHGNVQEGGQDMTQGQISTETYKRGTEVQGVQILNVICRICYNNKMLRSLVR